MSVSTSVASGGNLWLVLLCVLPDRMKRLGPTHGHLDFVFLAKACRFLVFSGLCQRDRKLL